LSEEMCFTRFVLRRTLPKVEGETTGAVQRKVEETENV